MALIENSAGQLPYRLLDFDQHSYEADDCFTRHMPKSKLDTAVYPIRSAAGRKVLLANDRVVTALEADLDRAYVPGSLVEMLKARSAGEVSEADRFYQPIQAEYRDHDARLTQLAEQQIDHSIIYPGGWALMAEAYLNGVGPLYDNIEAFNRWIAEDWGFCYQNTIFAPALLSMRDLGRACAELDRVLAGARFIMLPAGPAYGRSPGDPHFDPFWARINEAKAIVAYHICEFHYQANVASQWGWSLVPPFQFSAWQWQNTYGERPITDTLSALIFDNVRPLPGYQGPRQRVRRGVGASLHPAHGQEPRHGPERPLAGRAAHRAAEHVFTNHIRVVPYPEDNTVGLADRLGGVSCLVMGSDWPHAEGLREPADFYAKVEGLGDQNRRRFLRDNGLDLLGLK